MQQILSASAGRRTLLWGCIMVVAWPCAVLDAGTAQLAGATDLLVQLGDASVRLLSSAPASAGLTYVSVHENEQTAVTAARQLIARRGGRLLELRAQRQRLVSFGIEGVRYTFDPNRIFTAPGIEKTLRRYGPYTQAAHNAVAHLAEVIIEQVQRNLTPPIVAVHNNGAGSLSVQSYQRGGPLQAEVTEVSVHPQRDPDDFFLATERSLYERLHKLQFNVVLQSPRATDDGSLSVFCQQRGVPYLNVEAEYGHLAEQVRMLEAVLAVVGDRAT